MERYLLLQIIKGMKIRVIVSVSLVKTAVNNSDSNSDNDNSNNVCPSGLEGKNVCKWKKHQIG